MYFSVCVYLSAFIPQIQTPSFLSMVIDFMFFNSYKKIAHQFCICFSSLNRDSFGNCDKLPFKLQTSVKHAVLGNSYNVSQHEAEFDILFAWMSLLSLSAWDPMAKPNCILAGMYMEELARPKKRMQTRGTDFVELFHPGIIQRTFKCYNKS